MSAPEFTSPSSQLIVQELPTFTTRESQVADLLSSFSATARRATAFLACWPSNDGSIASSLLSFAANVAGVLPTQESEEDLQRAVVAMIEKMRSAQADLSITRTTSNCKTQPTGNTLENDNPATATDEAASSSDAGATHASTTIDEPKVEAESTQASQVPSQIASSAQAPTNTTPTPDDDQSESANVHVTSTSSTDDSDADEDEEPDEQTHPKRRRELFVMRTRWQSEDHSRSHSNSPSLTAVRETSPDFVQVPLESVAQLEAQVEFLDLTTLVPSPGSVPPRFARSSHSPPALQYPPSSYPQPTTEITPIQLSHDAPALPSEDRPSSSALDRDLSPAQVLVAGTSTAQAVIEPKPIASNTGNTTQQPNNSTKDDAGDNPASVPNNAAAGQSSSAASASNSGTSATTIQSSNPTPLILPPRLVRAPLRREGAIVIPSEQNNSASLPHRNVDPPTVRADSGTSAPGGPAPTLPTAPNSQRETEPNPRRLVRIRLRREGAIIIPPTDVDSLTVQEAGRVDTSGPIRSTASSPQLETGPLVSAEASTVTPGADKSGEPAAEEEPRESASEEKQQDQNEEVHEQEEQEQAPKKTRKRAVSAKGKGKEIVDKNKKEKENKRPRPNTRARDRAVTKEAVLGKIECEKKEPEEEPGSSGSGSKGKEKAKELIEVVQELEEHADTKTKPKTRQQSRATTATKGKKRAREVEKVDEEMEERGEDVRPTRRLRSTSNKKRI